MVNRDRKDSKDPLKHAFWQPALTKASWKAATGRRTVWPATMRYSLHLEQSQERMTLLGTEINNHECSQEPCGIMINNKMIPATTSSGAYHTLGLSCGMRLYLGILGIFLPVQQLSALCAQHGSSSHTENKLCLAMSQQSILPMDLRC